jgi:hypothetical protein
MRLFVELGALLVVAQPWVLGPAPALFVAALERAGTFSDDIMSSNAASGFEDERVCFLATPKSSSLMFCLLTGERDCCSAES